MATERAGHVCIVGSGPAGFYAAGFLLANSDVRVDMYERLPNPYGLVRAGIAPDHQHTKSVTKLFERIAASDRFRFFGNVTLGADVDTATLSDHYDAVVFAFGAMADRQLGVPGENLSGCMSATEFVGWYNGHPDFADIKPELSGGPVVVIGHGNVAADVARVIMSSVEHLARTDIADHALARLREASVQVVHVVGRKGPQDARFTAPELGQLGKISGVTATVDERDLDFSPPEGAGANRIPALFETFARATDAGDGRQIRFHFHLAPEAVFGLSHVTGVAFRDTRSGELVKMRAGLVIKSIGNIGEPCFDLPFDKSRQRIENIDGRICRSGQVLDGQYVVGWAKRGASGTVGTNRVDSEATCRLLLADLTTRDARKIGPDALVLRLGSSGKRLVSFADWQRIDGAEIEAGRPLRPRIKIVRTGGMLDLLAGEQSSAASAESCSRD